MSKKDEPITELDFKDYNFRKYEGLHKTYDYDKEKATLLAEAMTERNLLKKRIAELDALADDNTDLHQFMWTTREGTVLALHDIKDDHLQNILTHIVAHGGSISPTIKAEAVSRGLDIPEASTTSRAIRYLNAGREIDGDILDIEDIWDEQD